MIARKLPTRVYGGTWDGRNRMIVRASSWAAAVRYFNEAKCHLAVAHARAYGSVTGNAEELTLATETGVVWEQAGRNGPWRRVGS